MKKILVIDDEEGVRDAFELALEEFDYQVETAERGKIGVDKAAANKPDLVFTDLKMPGIDGVETMRRLFDLYPDLTVYVVTAFHEEFFDKLSAASEEGLDFNLLRKPIGAQQIQELVVAILNESPGKGGTL